MVDHAHAQKKYKGAVTLPYSYLTLNNQLNNKNIPPHAPKERMAILLSLSINTPIDAMHTITKQKPSTNLSKNLIFFIVKILRGAETPLIN